MSKLTSLKAALAAAVKEAAVAKDTGTAKWDEALDFAYQAMDLMPTLLEAIEAAKKFEAKIATMAVHESHGAELRAVLEKLRQA